MIGGTEDPVDQERSGDHHHSSVYTAKRPIKT